jgi:hypothetical protein
MMMKNTPHTLSAGLTYFTYLNNGFLNLQCNHMNVNIIITIESVKTINIYSNISSMHFENSRQEQYLLHNNVKI